MTDAPFSSPDDATVEAAKEVRLYLISIDELRTVYDDEARLRQVARLARIITDAYAEWQGGLWGQHKALRDKLFGIQELFESQHDDLTTALARAEKLEK